MGPLRKGSIVFAIVTPPQTTLPQAAAPSLTPPQVTHLYLFLSFLSPSFLYFFLVPLWEEDGWITSETYSICDACTHAGRHMLCTHMQEDTCCAHTCRKTHAVHTHAGRHMLCTHMQEDTCCAHTCRKTHAVHTHAGRHMLCTHTIQCRPPTSSHSRVTRSSAIMTRAP